MKLGKYEVIFRLRGYFRHWGVSFYRDPDGHRNLVVRFGKGRFMVRRDLW